MRKPDCHRTSPPSLYLINETSAITRLGEVTERLWRAPDLQAGLNEILEAVIDLLHADMGNIQIVDPDRGVLRMAAQRGLPADFLRVFREVRLQEGTACARAFRQQQLIVVENVDADEQYAPHWEHLRAGNCRAVQSAPLVGWGGKTLGALSVYFHTPRRPSETELRWLDLYARLATAFIERFHADEALRKRESQLHSALEAMTDAVFISDTDGRFIEFNEAFATVHKFASKDECAKTLAEYLTFLDVFLPSGELARLDQWAVPRALRGETAVNQEYTLRRTDTGEAWVGSYNFAPIRDDKGVIVGAVVVGRDITQDKQMIEALQASERQVRLSLEASHAGVWSADLCSDQVTWDERTAVFFGDNPASIETTLARVHEEDRKRMLDRLEEMRRTPGDDDWNVEFRMVSPNREVRWIQGIGKGERDSNGILMRVGGLALDVTARRQTEEDLVRTSQAFRDLVDNIPDGIARLDSEARYVFANRRLAQLGPGSPEDFVGKTLGSLTSQDSGPWVRLVKRVIASGKEEDLEYVSQRGGFTSELRFVPEKLPDGSVCSVLMIATDITERRRVEALAQERASIIETLFDTAAQGIFAIDAQGKIQLVNKMAGEMFGYAPGELRNQPLELLLPEALRRKHVGHRNSFMESPRTRPMGMGMDLLARKKDGSLFPVEVSLSHLQTERGVMAVSFVTDISVRKQHEAELRKLAAAVQNAEEDAARQLARELHDDITQRLAFLSLELRRNAADPVWPDFTKQLKSYQAKIQGISESLRNISHRMHPAILDDLGLRAALKDLCRELERASGVSVQYVSRGVPDKVPSAVALCIYRACQECFRNIAKHAQADEVSVILSSVGDMLELEIYDSGMGFDASRIKKGMGMYSMQERVRLANGTLAIDSVPGEGTRISIRLPVGASV